MSESFPIAKPWDENAKKRGGLGISHRARGTRTSSLFISFVGILTWLGNSVGGGVWGVWGVWVRNAKYITSFVIHMRLVTTSLVRSIDTPFYPMVRSMDPPFYPIVRSMDPPFYPMARSMDTPYYPIVPTTFHCTYTFQKIAPQCRIHFIFKLSQSTFKICW